MTSHTPRQLTLLLLAISMTCLTLLVPTHATAGTYWVDLRSDRGEVQQGVNGFGWLTYGGAFNTYGSTCDARPSQTFVAGSYCKLRFNVPAGLRVVSSADGGGIARGTYRVAHANINLRTERPGGSPAYTTDAHDQTTTHGPFGHGWGALGSIVDIGLAVKAGGATTGPTMNNWFHVDQFVALFDDPTAPQFGGWSVAGASSGGWRGPGCHEAWYSYSDTGSQMWSTSLTNLTTGALAHSWGANPGMTVVASGVGTATPSFCIAAPGTGAYTYRIAGVDRAGNASSTDQVLLFDTTRPTVGVPRYAQSEVQSGRRFTAAEDNYRPAISWAFGDAHSGISSVTATLGGQSIPVRTHDGVATLAPAAALPLGTRVLRLRVVDAVGNVTDMDRQIEIGDVTAPAIDVAAPGSRGSAEPVLDVSAHDDATGVDATSWAVEVNGVPVVVGSDSARLYASLGRLVDGTHAVVVSVRDGAGNTARRVISYEADADVHVPQLTGAQLDGITMYEQPASAQVGETYRFKAVFAARGRPVTGRAEIRRGSVTVAGKEIESNGTVDLAVTFESGDELLLYGPAGAGLQPVPLLVRVRGAATDAGRGDQPAAASSYPRNTIYYVGGIAYWNGVPLAESGSTGDRVAPRWRLALTQRRAGVVQRSGRMTVHLWTNELSVVTLTPLGASAKIVTSPRRSSRAIQLVAGPRSALGRRLRAARAGSIVTVRVRLVAVDRNHNRSVAKIVSFQVRA